MSYESRVHKVSIHLKLPPRILYFLFGAAISKVYFLTHPVVSSARACVYYSSLGARPVSRCGRCRWIGAAAVCVKGKRETSCTKTSITHVINDVVRKIEVVRFARSPVRETWITADVEGQQDTSDRHGQQETRHRYANDDTPRATWLFCRWWRCRLRRYKDKGYDTFKINFILAMIWIPTHEDAWKISL